LYEQLEKTQSLHEASEQEVTY